jgi:hypothetical protein
MVFYYYFVTKQAERVGVYQGRPYVTVDGRRVVPTRRINAGCLYYTVWRTEDNTHIHQQFSTTKGRGYACMQADRCADASNMRFRPARFLLSKSSSV